MRELHVSIVYTPSREQLRGNLFALAHAKEHDINHNCVVCQVMPGISDDEALERVRQYFLHELGRQPNEFELRLGHNELKPTPHREYEPVLFITQDAITKGRKHETFALPLQ